MIANLPFNSLEQAIIKAHATKDLKFLLLPYLSFRAYVIFTGKEKKKSHFYGNEHQCTYNQCLFGKIPHIQLRRLKGYTDLVNLIENNYKGKYLTAKIYMRDPQTGQFDILCREYFKGGLQECNDPVIDENEMRTLFYYIKKNYVIITETDPALEDFKIPE